jgi:hypothetical protein
VSSPPAAAATSSDSDGSRWGWIIAAIALLAAVIGATVMLLAQRRRRRWEAWRALARNAVEAAHLAQGLLPVSGAAITDVEHWDSVRERVEQAAQSLDTVGTDAPAPEAARATRTAAQTLRDAVFVLEATRLMHDTNPAPTDTQVADAEGTARARRADLDVALAHLDQIVRLPSTPGSPPGPNTAGVQPV